MRVSTILPLLFLLCIINHLYGQNDTQAILKGRVVDAASGAPLEYTTIQVYDRESDQLATGGITDEAGQFEIKCPIGQYYILLDFMGYEQLKQMDIEINIEASEKDLGTIELSSNVNTLDEIVVQAEKSTLELSLDKKVFNVGKDLGNAGGSALEILSNIPSVTVDGDGAVKLRGSSDVRILIDGKPSGLVSFKGGAGLEQLQGGLIEKVEIITNPSARYEAEGMAGILNIVLKKERRNGLNGSFEVTTGYPLNLGAAANINYRRKKVNFFVNYGIAYRIRPSIYSLYQEVYDADTTFVSIQSYDGEHIGFVNTARAGLDFFLNEKNILTASYSLSRNSGKRLTDLLYEDFLFSESNPIRRIERTQDEDEIEPIAEYLLNYKKLFGQEGHELTASIRYLDHWEESDQVYTETAYFGDGNRDIANDILQTSFNEETERHLLFQLDYTQPFGEEGKVEAGLLASFRDMRNDYIVQIQNDLGQFEVFEGLDNDFTYDENISAAYLIYGNKIRRFTYQLGVRGEWTDITTLLEKTGEENPRDYVNFFPSAHFTYSLPGDNDLQLTYSRRIRRPTYNELSPFVTFSDARNYFSGNPDLNPEYSDVFELGHVKYFEKGSFASTLYYRYTNEKISGIRIVDLDGRSTRFPENFNTGKVYGSEFIGTYNPTKWWKMDMGLNFFRELIDGTNIDPNFSSDTYTWFIQKTSRLTLSKSSTLQIRANYHAPQQTPQGRQLSLYFFDFAFNKELLQNKATLTFNVTDIFNHRIERAIITGDNFYTKTRRQRPVRQINLSFKYRLNQ